MSEQPEPPQRGSVEEIFHAARSLPAAQRGEFLQRACGGDAQLRRRVEGLLRASESGGGFLPETPRQTPAGASFDPATAVITERPGDRIGNYELLEQIGAGGFGVVFKAKQLAPIQRIVALKIIKLGMDTAEVIARFEAERQALAAMEHPNIAKVFDAGATETGRPFFVMEFVEGISLTAYADQNRLSTRARLDLFVAVCRAVQHAHTKGVIHRDLKPSNVLVATRDGEPTPKLIDFGIAKATAQSAGFHTVATALGVLGTPAYMSPEQTDWQGSDIDTRSDVYSLGVLLYELLTGQPPFEPSEMVRLALDEVLKTIRERDPPAPSARLQTLARQTLNTTALNRQIEPARLTHLMRGDLDCIVMKCLEKDRNRRYGSATELALDVRRHLANEPIAASPPDFFYRSKKFARRHRLALATCGGMFLLALGGWIFWLLQPGTLLVEFEPPDAQMEIDGHPRAFDKVPAQLKLAAGVHQLRFHKAEFEDEPRTVAVPRGGFARVPHFSLKHFQGTLDVDSTMPGTGIEFAGQTYFEGIKNQRADTGEYDLTGVADGCFEVRHHLVIQRGQATVDRLSLEKGVAWRFTSPAVQGDCVIVTNVPSGQPAVIVENFLNAIVFLSAADGAVLAAHEIPYGRVSRLDLGGTIGKILVTGADEPGEGPELTAFADAWPTNQLWKWKGPTNNFSASAPLQLALIRLGAEARVGVAARNGHIYELDENGREVGPEMIFSRVPLSGSPDMLNAWSRGGESFVLTTFRTAATNASDAGKFLFHAALFNARTGKAIWEKELGAGSADYFGDFEHDGAPGIVLLDEHECRFVSAETGELRGHLALPGRATCALLAEPEGPGHDDLILVFGGEPSLPLMAVRPADATVLWRGPTNVYASQHAIANESTLQASPGRIVIQLRDSLVSLEPATGKVIWKTSVVPVDYLKDEISGNVYMTTREQRLFCFDADGRTNWILHLHDEVAPHAVIPNGNGAGHLELLLQGTAKAVVLAHWPRLLWNLPTTAALEAGPLIQARGAGKINVFQTLPGEQNFALACLDGESGRTIWKDSEFYLPPNRPPALAELDGVMSLVAVCSANGSPAVNLIARRADDGQLIRSPRVDIPSWTSCTPAVADFRGIGHRDVAVSTWETEEIVMLDGRSGEALWRHKTEGPNMGELSAADLDGDGLADVIAASGDGHAYALNGKTGALLWESAGTNCASISRPLVASLNDDGALQVLLMTFDGKLEVLDAKTGATSWSPAISGGLRITGQVTLARANQNTILLVPLGTNGVVAFDWRQRREIWRSPAGAAVIATPVVADLAHDGERQVILGTSSGEVLVLRLTDGKTLWRAKVANKLIAADPAVADLNHDGIDDVLIASHDFTLYAIDGREIISAWRRP
jgi:serine/threonine protein kinase/outer membrane protein assembly factor BamB